MVINDKRYYMALSAPSRLQSTVPCTSSFSGLPSSGSSKTDTSTSTEHFIAGLVLSLIATTFDRRRSWVLGGVGSLYEMKTDFVNVSGGLGRQLLSIRAMAAVCVTDPFSELASQNHVKS